MTTTDNNRRQEYTFHVHGMHCNSCVLTIESALKDVPNIHAVSARLTGHAVDISGEFGDTSPEHIAEKLTSYLEPHGYRVSIERQEHSANWREFGIAVPIALGFVLLFVLLQKLGIVNLVGAGKVTYGTAFVVGIIASLSTCMAVVGGLVLSMSATFAKEGDRIRPQVMFHGGRIVAFFLLGGVIGAIGSAFTLNAWGTFILGFIIAIVMLILGINLLDVFPWAKRLQPSMPKFIARHAHGVAKFNHTLTPLLVGIATFFLPCGFTQSMQLYALTTGGFLAGGLTMLAFALGTLPVLALISFSSLGLRNSTKSGLFFKSAGLIVILFALFNLINSLVVIGLFPPVFTF
ncbi:MAG: sulfite exporter TauE/SafE family protein [Candidatus Pacebacteria bacterium]|nr:sulfite exporter TauE/SafE family protein [Candidatus Paceibacterota bacterium]